MYLMMSFGKCGHDLTTFVIFHVWLLHVYVFIISKGIASWMGLPIN
jgi:hypothetical protein